MAVKSKKKHGSIARTGSVDVGTAGGVAPPDPTLLVAGSFVAHYVAQSLAGPQATIVQALFKVDNSVHGVIHRNPGGTQDKPLWFRGSYALEHDTDLGTIFGKAYFDLSATITGPVFRRQELFVVKRSTTEIFFLLAASYDLTTTTPTVRLDTNAIVEGVFYKTA